LIEPQRIAMLQGGVSIVASSRGADGWPALARASGCRVSAGGARLTLFLAASRSQELLAAVRATRVVAAVFNEPATHRSVQFKGVDAAIEAPHSDDYLLARNYTEAFAAAIAPLGHPAPIAHAMVASAPEDLVALSFSPLKGFDQTPGPRAGAPL
jgi:hypothetical protein